MRNAPVIIIGAAQAGLAVAYHLARQGVGCTLLDAHARVGDAWRIRWDSLRLFSPARYSALPEWPFPGDPMHLPTKDEVADRQEAFARHHGLDVRLRHKVEALIRHGDGYALTVRELGTGTTTTWEAQTVVVATGAFGTPWIPAFSPAADPAIHQVHVAGYRRPGDLPEGPVLVVGTGASGSQVAVELAATRKVYLSGPETPSMPRRFLGKDLYWWLYATGLAHIKRDSWLGRRYLLRNVMGDAIIGKSLRQLTAENHLLRRGDLVGFQQGLPRFATGQTADDIKSIVWATGYRNDYQWIHLPVFDAQGQPLHHRGVVHQAPGIYFVGLKFLYQAHSANLGGVAQDAQYIATHIARPPQSPKSPPPKPTPPGH